MYVRRVMSIKSGKPPKHVVVFLTRNLRKLSSFSDHPKYPNSKQAGLLHCDAEYSVFQRHVDGKYPLFWG
jgi:hypothetical protein